MGPTVPCYRDRSQPGSRSPLLFLLSSGSNAFGGCTHSYRACPAANLSPIPSAAYVCQVNVPDQHERMDTVLSQGGATKNGPRLRSNAVSRRDLSSGCVLRRPRRLVLEGDGHAEKDDYGLDSYALSFARAISPIHEVI